MRREPASLPRFLADFPFATDADAFQFLSGLKASDLRLAEASSKALGQAFVANAWGDAARRAVSWLNARQDLRPMYRECISLVSIFDRLWVSWGLGMSSPLTVDQAWEALRQAAHLYPSGPWHDAIWGRSGGDEEDLIYQGTGKATWHRCIQDLRNGMAPGADAVLKDDRRPSPQQHAQATSTAKVLAMTKLRKEFPGGRALLIGIGKGYSGRWNYLTLYVMTPRRWARCCAIQSLWLPGAPGAHAIGRRRDAHQYPFGASGPGGQRQTERHGHHLLLWPRRSVGGRRR